MTSLKYYNSIILFMMIIAIYLFSHLISFCYASQIKSRTTHHTLDLSQHGQLSRCINPSSTTNPAPGKDSPTAVFEVYRRRSLCVDGATSSSSPSSAEKILRQDKQRVKHISQTIMKTNMNTNIHGVEVDDDHDSVPVQWGDSLDYNSYIVRMGLGTPTRYLHLILDTGSDLTWTQCLPCLWNCYSQRDKTFDPRKSTTYSNISCTDPECPQSNFFCYKNRTCLYYAVYGGDQAYSIGFMAKDKLTVTKNDAFPNFMFGCGKNHTGDFGETAGILGLSRGPLSAVSQTKQKFGEYFSYFLPSNVSSMGHLTFGRNINNTKGVKFTHLIQDPMSPYYFIKITSITVGCKRLRIDPSVFENDKNIIDSGTVVTCLPKKAYIAMRDEFKRQMNTKRYLIAPPMDEFDTCFHVPNSNNVEFPTITFTFEGDVMVEVGRFGIFYVVDPRLVCFAFRGITGEEGDDISVFGEMVQQNMEVVYDVAGGKLGFGVPTG